MLLIVLQPEIPMPLDQSAVAVPKLGATLTRRPCKRGNCTPLPDGGHDRQPPYRWRVSFRSSRYSPLHL